VRGAQAKRADARAGAWGKTTDRGPASIREREARPRPDRQRRRERQCVARKPSARMRAPAP